MPGFEFLNKNFFSFTKKKQGKQINKFSPEVKINTERMTSSYT